MGIQRRTFIKGAVGIGAGLILPTDMVVGANERVNIAVCGIRAKGISHINGFQNLPNVNVIALCDPDESFFESRSKGLPGVKCFKDYRKLLEMKDLDALVIATPNHWHAAMTIAACQAGKHVYVEKPVSHSIWEGRKMCEAQEKYKRVVQAGTQQLSCPAVAACGKDIRAGKYGKVKWVHCFKLQTRKPIGKLSQPLVIPSHIDYNLWAGPAPMDDIYRPSFHYDWHWDFRWGDGEMGNWCVHYTSDLCTMLGWDTMPDSVTSAGGRFNRNDAADTPNMLFSMMKYKDVPLTLEIRNLTIATGSKRTPNHLKKRDGNIIMCEDGLIFMSRGGGKAFTPDGTTMIKQYKGNGGIGHRQNFIDAIKANDHSILNAPVEGSHIASGICHLSNISYQLGEESPEALVRERMNEYEDIKSTVNEQLIQIKANDGDMNKIILGPKLTFDPKAERFTGNNAAAANDKLSYKMRKEFAIPAHV